MRVTILSQWYDPEPVAIPGLLARWLSERGHDVNIVTGFPSYPGGSLYAGYHYRIFTRESLSRIPVTRLPLYPSHDSSAIRRMGNYASFALSASTLGTLLAPKSDVVYVYHPPGTVGLPAMVWHRLRGLPFVYHVQDLWPDSVVESDMLGRGLVRRSIEKGLDRWCCRIYRAAGALAVISPGFKRILISRGVPSDKIAVIPNWADESTFFPAPPDSDLANKLGLLGGVNVIYAGNLGRYQGLDTAIRAAARVQHLTGFRLVFIGSGQVEHELRKLAADLGLSNVVFLGRRSLSDMGPVTNLADALLVSLKDLPFFSATIPGKTQVGLAAGRPLVMAVRGDASDLVRKSGGGIVCDPGDESSLASAFEQLYAMSPDERNTMGQRGRAFYLKELALARGALRMEKLLASVAQSAPRSRSSREGGG